eukprot:gene29221-5725_t
MTAAQTKWKHLEGFNCTGEQVALEEEERLRDISLTWTFRSGQLDEEGEPRRLGTDEVAVQMDMREKRVAELVSRAMRAYPMVADDVGVEVLFEDEHLIAVNKPFGVQSAPVHRFRGGSMVNRLIHYLGGKEPLVIHRLDRDTSGLLLFAKTKEAVTKVHAQFRKRTMKKCYLALCMGVPDSSTFSIDCAIGDHATVAYARSGTTLEDDPDAKAASTSFFVLSENKGIYIQAGGPAVPGEMFDHSEHGKLLEPPTVDGGGGAALVACAPHTGRTHQIRIHMQAAGHPLIGDDLYGASVPWIQRQALHSVALSFTHPISNEEMTLVAPLHQDFVQALGQWLPQRMSELFKDKAATQRQHSGRKRRSRQPNQQ